MARIKQEERDRALKAERKRLDQHAQRLGFDNHADMLTRIEASGGATRPAPAAPAAPTAAPPTPGQTIQPSGEERLMRENQQLRQSNERLLEEKRRINRSRAHEERGRKTAERDLAATRAESELRVVAVQAGVQDVDYAIHLVRRHLKGKQKSYIASFDEAKFFNETLRQSHPNIYRLETRPATTSPSTTPSTSPTAAPAVPASPGNGTPARDARLLKPDEFASRLTEMGLSLPSLGISSG
jgi:hypothetical protein